MASDASPGQEAIQGIQGVSFSKVGMWAHVVQEEKPGLGKKEMTKIIENNEKESPWYGESGR